MDYVVIDNNGEIGLKENLKSSFVKKFAAAMAAPIRRSLDYQGLARRAIVIDQLPAAAQSTYDKDIDVSSLVVSNDSDNRHQFKHNIIVIDDSGNIREKSKIFARRVQFPLFEIASNPIIRLSDVKQRRFKL